MHNKCNKYLNAGGIEDKPIQSELVQKSHIKYVCLASEMHGAGGAALLQHLALQRYELLSYLIILYPLLNVSLY